MSKQPSAKKTAANTASPPPNTGAPAAKKAPRKPKIPALSLSQKLDLMNFVKAADPTLPDVTLADRASELVGRKVLAVTVTDYRKQFGIASVPKPSVTQLMGYVERLRGLLVAAHIDVPSMVEPAPEPPQEAPATDSKSDEPSGANDGD